MQEKVFEYFDLKDQNGKYKTLDELKDEAMRVVADALENLDDTEQLEIGNEWRENNGYACLHILDEVEVNDALEDCEPWEILNFERGKWDDYFSYDGFDFCTTSDVWEDIDVDDLSEEIVNGGIDTSCREIEEILAEYHEAIVFLENLNEYREMAREVLVKFTAGEAGWNDLYACLDKLVKTDEAWA